MITARIDVSRVVSKRKLQLQLQLPQKMTKIYSLSNPSFKPRHFVRYWPEAKYLIPVVIQPILQFLGQASAILLLILFLVWENRHYLSVPKPLFLTIL